MQGLYKLVGQNLRVGDVSPPPLCGDWDWGARITIGDVSPPRMKLRMDSFEMVTSHVRVDLCRRNISVP